MMKQKRIVAIIASLILSAMMFTPALSNAGLPLPPAPPLPPLILPAPPPVFVIPGTYAYFAPDVDAELFFYRGFWYRRHAEHWYRSAHYGGPWGFVVLNKIPRVLINVPSGYRNVPPGHQRIPYQQLRRNWRPWERERHWDGPGKRKYKNTREHEHTGHGSGNGHGKGHGH